MDHQWLATDPPTRASRAPPPFPDDDDSIAQ
jgi:hypothetical protein